MREHTKEEIEAWEAIFVVQRNTEEKIAFERFMLKVLSPGDKSR